MIQKDLKQINKLVTTQDLSPYDVKVFLYILSKTGGKEFVAISGKQFKEDLGLSRSTALKSIANLEEQNLLNVKRTFIGGSENRQNLTNKFKTIKLEEI